MDTKKIDIIKSSEQLRLFGYDVYFNFFVQMFNNKTFPKVSLLSGPKGLGKSTFIYHFINYLFSINDEKKYDFNDKKICTLNKNFKLLMSNLHPNFYLIDNSLVNKQIGINEIRQLLSFLSKSTFLNNFKFVMINNVENLNKNSSNALLKAIEEPSENTYFFLIYDNKQKILDTIRSRCLEFKFFFTFEQKKEIFLNLSKLYSIDDSIEKNLDNLHYETPGNLLEYILFLNNEKINLNLNNLSEILLLINKYKKKKDPKTFYIIRLLIEKYYHQLILNKNINLTNVFSNVTKIFNKIHLMKAFNLDEDNSLIYIESILKNEQR